MERERSLLLPTCSWCCIAAALLLAVGSQWDSYVHITTGHILLALAHLIILGSLLCFVGAAGCAYVLSRRVTSGPIKQGLKRVAWSGAVVFVAMIGIDELWHVFFGIDQTAWSPPHVLATLGMLSALVALLTVEARFSLCGPRALFVATALFLVVSFNFIEYDLPYSAGLAQVRPAWTYVLLATCMYSAVTVLVTVVTRSAGIAAAAAAMGWMIFALTGVCIEYVVGVEYVRVPFPFFVPAILFWLLCGTGRKNLMLLAGFCATLYFWSLVVWSLATPALPQRISGTFAAHVLWFLVGVPIISALVNVIASLFVSVDSEEDKGTHTILSLEPIWNLYRWYDRLPEPRRSIYFLCTILPSIVAISAPNLYVALCGLLCLFLMLSTRYYFIENARRRK